MANKVVYVDPRFEPWLNTRDDPNVQRERWKESISTVIAMVGESEGGDEGGEENSEEENPLKPSVAYAITEVAALDRVVDVTMEGIRAEEVAQVKEQFTFGAELEKQLSSIGNLGESMAAIYQESLGSDTDVTPGKIDVTNQMFSFIVTRPFTNNEKTLWGKYISHSFIVVGARYLGDTEADIYSFGPNAEGILGRLDESTQTAINDYNRWKSLKENHSLEGVVGTQLIPSLDQYVRAYAEAFVEYASYHEIGFSCHTATKAIADAAAGMSVPMPPGRWEPGTHTTENVLFNLLEILKNYETEQDDN